MIEFQPMPKMARLSREIVVTEKIDGTNASIYIADDGSIQAASRTRWITPDNDNYGFAKWVEQNKEDLLKLGTGHHFGEWWGNGIQRNYDQKTKIFSLFNTSRWSNEGMRPSCCNVVPVLYMGEFDTVKINTVLEDLKRTGSIAGLGYMNPEGIVVYHPQSNMMLKKTYDDRHKELIK